MAGQIPRERVGSRRVGNRGGPAQNEQTGAPRGLEHAAHRSGSAGPVGWRGNHVLKGRYEDKGCARGWRREQARLGLFPEVAAALHRALSSETDKPEAGLERKRGHTRRKRLSRRFPRSCPWQFYPRRPPAKLSWISFSALEDPRCSGAGLASHATLQRARRRCG